MEKLVDDLTGALADESHRNEILSVGGDHAVLVIECLDKVSGSESSSYSPSLYRTIDHLFQPFSSQKYPNTFKSVLHNLEALPFLSIPPPVLLDRSKHDNVAQSALHIRHMR